MSQELINREYRRLKGLPQSYDPAVEDPWDGLRGEGGASYWGDDPLQNIPGGTQGLKDIVHLRLLLQTLLLQVCIPRTLLAAASYCNMLLLYLTAACLAGESI